MRTAHGPEGARNRDGARACENVERPQLQLHCSTRGHMWRFLLLSSSRTNTIPWTHSRDSLTHASSPRFADTVTWHGARRATFGCFAAFFVTMTSIDYVPKCTLGSATSIVGGNLRNSHRQWMRNSYGDVSDAHIERSTLSWMAPREKCSSWRFRCFSFGGIRTLLQQQQRVTTIGFWRQSREFPINRRTSNRMAKRNSYMGDPKS